MQMQIDKPQKKHVFQIRKVPLKRFIPEKTPELYALDVHSICLPIRKKKSLNWSSIHCDPSHLYEQQFNEQIIYSQAYQQLYSQYIRLRQQRSKQKNQIQSEIDKLDQQLQKQKNQKKRLVNLRDDLEVQNQGLRDKLNQCRDQNYNLQWQAYQQRGAYIANIHGYSFLEPNEMTYEELLQIQQQIGSVSKGMSIQDIDALQKVMYECKDQQRQICCVCYDEIQNGQFVTILRCKHSHHCDCIRDWLLKQKVCPICKKQVIVEHCQISSKQSDHE